MKLEAHDSPAWGAKLVPWGEGEHLEAVTESPRYDVVWAPATPQTRIPKMGSSQEPEAPLSFIRRKAKK